MVREKQPPFPTDSRMAMDYLAKITRTNAFLDARQIVGAEYADKNLTTPARNLSTFVLQNTVAYTAKAVNRHIDQYEGRPFSPIYNDLLSTLPDLSLGIHNLNHKIGDAKDNKRKIIPFNHTIKRLINENSSTSPADLQRMLKSTLEVGQYNSELLDNINKRIPGMSHELALESNLLYLPGDPEIINTDIEQELKGIDYIARADNHIEITIDGKASQYAAEEAQAEHEAWRQRNNITTPDNHLIIYTGYTGRDFIPDKIGRVTEEARLREQPRINAMYMQKYTELTQARQSA